MLCFPKYHIAKRVILAFHLFLSCFFNYLISTSLSFQIIFMTKPTPLKNGTIPVLADHGPRYDWSEHAQATTLASYYYGYCISGLLAGWLAESFDTVNLISLTTACESLLVLLIPLIAPIHWGLVTAVRIVCGFMGGILLPACHTLISKWAPPTEKGKFVSMLLGGSLGTFASNVILGYIIPLVGWRLSFYVLSIGSLTWVVSFFFICYQSPEAHPYITDEEAEYIEDSITGLKLHTGFKVNPPIGKILTNFHYLALLCLHFGDDFGYVFVLSDGPKYISEGLRLSYGKSGIFSGMPCLFAFFGGIAFGLIGDQLRKKSFVSLFNLRRFFVIFSHILPGAMFFGMAYCTIEEKYIAVSLLSLSLGSNGASIMTNNANNQDLSPNFAGTLFGYCNTIGGIAGFIMPSLAGHFLYEQTENTLDGWSKSFITVAVVYWITGAIWILLGSASIQEFNYHQIGKIKFSLIDNSSLRRPTRDISRMQTRESSRTPTRDSSRTLTPRESSRTIPIRDPSRTQTSDFSRNRTYQANKERRTEPEMEKKVEKSNIK